MSAYFDPWTVLAEIRNETPTPPNPANPPNPSPPASLGLGALGGLGGGHPSELKNAEPNDPWLRHAAQALIETLNTGAEREADDDGWIVLVRPSGHRHVLAPRIVAQMEAAGLMPPLPPSVSPSSFAAHARPTAWSNPTDLPLTGDRCGCGGRCWWTTKQRPDGWCCSTCHPPVHLPAEAIHEVTT